MAAVTATAGANIALVKYWGKRAAAGNLPAVGSLSITLEALQSRTRCELDPSLDADDVELNGRREDRQSRRISQTLARLREITERDTGVSAPFARITSQNNFPTGAGLASSASGFAALVVSAAAAYGLNLTPARLSALAREGSGSAARSIFGGYVEMARGERADGADAIATPLMEASEWPLEVVIAITASGEKAIGSTEGMNLTARTSPYWQGWIDAQQSDLAEARQAVLSRDFERLADISEYSCLKMHALAMSARPGLLYWNGATMECMHRVRALRHTGHATFFTVDAGPQVKAICAPAHVDAVTEALTEVPGVQRVLRSHLGPGTRIIDSDTPT